MRSRVLILVGLLGWGAALSAQDFESELVDNRSAALASPTPLAGSATPSNVNYLDLFIAALQSFSDSGGEAITLDYNVPEGVFGNRLSSKLQLGAKKPELNAKYLSALGSNTGRITLLQNELGLADDITVTFSISPRAQEKAKEIRNALAVYEHEVVANKTSPAPLNIQADGAVQPSALLSTDTVKEASRRLIATDSGFELLDAMLRGDVGLPPAAAENTDTSTFASLDKTTRTGFAALAKEIAQDMGNVAAQQSKLNLNASYRHRRETAGPNEWFVKASYEHGFGANVGKRIRAKRNDCAQKYFMAVRDDGCAENVAAALREAADSAPVQTGSRLTFALEYRNHSTVDIAVDNFKLPSSKSLVASLNYGKDVFANKQAKERSGRVELVAAYDDVSGDKNRKDRLIGTVTYSQRINEDFYIPVSLVYANHADYLSNVDRKLNAHFGIAYKLQNKPKAAN